MLDAAEHRHCSYSYKIPARRGGQVRKTAVWGTRTARADDALAMKDLLKFELNGYGKVRRYWIAIQLRGFVLPVTQRFHGGLLQQWGT